MTDTQKFARSLGIKLRERGWLIVDLERLSGIPHQSLYRYLNAKAAPGFANFVVLSRLFECYSLKDWGLLN